MTRQMEFDWTSRGWRKYAVEQCRRLRYLSVVEGGRSITLNASEAKVLLLKIADFDVCYCSMEYLADQTGIRLRNVERLIKAMREHGMIETRKHPRDRGQFPANQYVVFWSDLIDSPSATPSATKRAPSATPSATPSAIMADKDKNYKKEENNNNQEQETVVVVSPLIEVLEEIGVFDPLQTFALAKSALKLTDEQILERIEHYRSLPHDHPVRKRGPGVLHFWLTRPRSWQQPDSGQGQRLQFRKLASCTDENRRGELVRYGKSKGWTIQQMQAAVTRFENECLQRTEENSCTPQPGKSETNQLALVRTQRQLHQQF